MVYDVNVDKMGGFVDKNVNNFLLKCFGELEKVCTFAIAKAKESYPKDLMAR